VEDLEAVVFFYVAQVSKDDHVVEVVTKNKRVRPTLVESESKLDKLQ